MTCYFRDVLLLPFGAMAYNGKANLDRNKI